MGNPLHSTKENANQFYRCVRAQAELEAIRFWADFRLADYHNSLDFMRNRTNTC